MVGSGGVEETGGDPRKWMGNVHYGLPGRVPFTGGPRGTAQTLEIIREQVEACCLMGNAVPL